MSEDEAAPVTSAADAAEHTVSSAASPAIIAAPAPVAAAAGQPQQGAVKVLQKPLGWLTSRRPGRIGVAEQRDQQPAAASTARLTGQAHAHSRPADTAASAVMTAHTARGTDTSSHALATASVAGSVAVAVPPERQTLAAVAAEQAALNPGGWDPSSSSDSDTEPSRVHTALADSSDSHSGSGDSLSLTSSSSSSSGAGVTGQPQTASAPQPAKGWHWGPPDAGRAAKWAGARAARFAGVATPAVRSAAQLMSFPLRCVTFPRLLSRFS